MPKSSQDKRWHRLMHQIDWSHIYFKDSHNWKLSGDRLIGYLHIVIDEQKIHWKWEAFVVIFAGARYKTLIRWNDVTGPVLIPSVLTNILLHHSMTSNLFIVYLFASPGMPTSTSIASVSIELSISMEPSNIDLRLLGSSSNLPLIPSTTPVSSLPASQKLWEDKAIHKL